MPPKNQQQNMNNPMTKLFGDIDGMIANSVKRDDLMKVMTAILEATKKVEARIVENVAKNKDGMDIELSAIKGHVKDIEVSLNHALSEMGAKNGESLGSAIKQLREEVKRVQNMIPELPDYSDRFEEIESKIPVLPREQLGEDYRNALEALPEGDKLATTAIENLDTKLEELEKRIVVGGRGGGTTNMRIIQAFKTILKTEAPVGALDGVNTTYTLTQPIFAILGMTLNGETIAQLPNYTIAGKTITFSTALPAAYSGKDWEVKYI